MTHGDLSSLTASQVADEFFHTTLKFITLLRTWDPLVRKSHPRREDLTESRKCLTELHAICMYFNDSMVQTPFGKQARTCLRKLPSDRRPSAILQLHNISTELTQESFKLLCPANAYDELLPDFTSIKDTEFKRVWVNLRYLLKDELEVLDLQKGCRDEVDYYYTNPSLTWESRDLREAIGLIPPHVTIEVKRNKRVLWTVWGDDDLNIQEHSLFEHAICAVFHCINSRVSSPAVRVELKRRNLPQGQRRVRATLAALVEKGTLDKEVGKNGYILNEYIGKVNWPVEPRRCVAEYAKTKKKP